MRGAPLDQRVERRAAPAARARLRPSERLDRRRIVRRPPAPFERLLVGVDRDAVELDRALDRGAADRQEAALPGGAEHEQVRRDRVAEQALARRCASRTSARSPSDGGQALDHRLAVDAPVRIAGELGGRDQVGVDHGPGRRLELGQGTRRRPRRSGRSRSARPPRPRRSGSRAALPASARCGHARRPRRISARGRSDRGSSRRARRDRPRPRASG